MTVFCGSPHIAIAGCGLGGIALAICLRKAGIDSFTIYERASDLGGVWRDNRYPGAACDVPSRLYSFSFEWDYRWSRDFAPQAEIHGYIRHCVDKYDVGSHIRFDTEIVRARFDAERGRWSLETGGGERIDADIFVAAVGLFNKPWLPDLPGRDIFQGPQFHSAQWNHSVDLSGRTVAVVGTGASAIQFVPELTKTVGRLQVYQRSAQYVFPMRSTSPWGEGFDWLRWFRPWRRYERQWIFREFERGIPRRASQSLTRQGEAQFRALLDAEVSDPDLREKLMPNYPLGCKRVLQSDVYYRALQQDNVEVITDPIVQIKADGIKTKDNAERACDAIVYGTGFATTDYLAPMAIEGLAGIDLNQAWSDGAEAFLGVTVTGFPNFFMLYGPNTNSAGSIIYMLECQSQHIVRCIEALRQQGAAWLMPRADAQRAYNDEIQSRLAKTVLVAPNCHSYFQAANGKVTTQWPGLLQDFRQCTEQIDESNYVFAAAPGMQ